MNLWKETIDVLSNHSKDWDSDVKYVIGSKNENRSSVFDFQMSKDNFKVIAENYDYYDGYGAVEVPFDLAIVGDNWWLERFEYDGSEQWVYKTFPRIPSEVLNVKGISTKYYTAQWEFA